MLHLIWSSNASQSLNKLKAKRESQILSLSWQKKRLHTRQLLKRQMKKSKKRPNLWKHQAPSISILCCLRRTWTQTSTSTINKVSQMRKMNHTKKKTSTNTWPVKMNYSKLKGKSVAQKVKAIEVRSTFKIVWQDRLKLMTLIKLDKQRKTNLIWKRLRLKVTTSKWNSSIDNHWCSNQDSIQDKNSCQLTMSHLKKLKNRENKKHWRKRAYLAQQKKMEMKR